MVKLYIKNNVTNQIHEYGSDPNDSLVLDRRGRLKYVNIIDDKANKRKYSFVFKNGLDPRESNMVIKYHERPYIDIGGEYSYFNENPIENIEIVYDTSWMQKVADEVAPTRAERVFG